MAYSPTNWVDGTTPVDASNMNKLEQAVSENSDLIDNLILTPANNTVTDMNDTLAEGRYTIGNF